MDALVIPAVVVIGILAIGYVLLLRNHSWSREKMTVAQQSDVATQVRTGSPLPRHDLSVLPEQFIVLDLETTGLSPERNEIIEIGAIRVHRDSSHHDVFQTLVKPKKKVPKFITEMTGISQAMVESNGDPLEVALADFMEFIGDLPLVAFNAQFDMGFLRSAANRNGIVIKNRYACALKLSRRAWPGLASYRLDELSKMGSSSEEDTHRAVADCQRTMIVFAAAASEVGEKIQWDIPRN
jgi:DNA polymerase III epsilon subunit family exonuclease